MDEIRFDHVKNTVTIKLNSVDITDSSEEEVLDILIKLIENIKKMEKQDGEIGDKKFNTEY